MVPRPGTPQHEITSPEGFDIYFFNDRSELAKLVANNTITTNKLSIGQLVNDLFDYYSHTFKWHTEVVSLRTPGGILSKREKKWTSAVQRTSKLQGNYKDRYLISIEDPFEITHNVGRPCFDSGAQAVKIEFQRASAILNELTHIDPENPSVIATPQIGAGVVDEAVGENDNDNDNDHDVNSDINADIDTIDSTNNEHNDVEPASSPITPTTPQLQPSTVAAPSSSLSLPSQPHSLPHPKTLEEAYALTMDKLLEPRAVSEKFHIEEEGRIQKERRVLIKMVRQGVTTGEMKAMMVAAANAAREARDDNNTTNNNSNNSSSSNNTRVNTNNKRDGNSNNFGAARSVYSGDHRSGRGDNRRGNRGKKEEKVEIDLEKYRGQIYDF